MTDAEKDKEKLPLDLQIQTLTRNNGILKKAYMEEKKNLQEMKKKNEELFAKVQEMEVLLMKKTEENDSLQLSVSKQSKRIESMMEQMNEVKANSTKKKSFLNNLWSGKSKETAEKMMNDLKIIQDELQTKIEENEYLHMQMFDLKSEHKHTMEELETKIQKYLQLSETQEKLISELKVKEKGLCDRLEDVETKKRDLELELDQQISELQELTRNYNTFREESRHTIGNLENYIVKRIPFDDTKNVANNVVNAKRYTKFIAIKQCEAFVRMGGALANFLNVFEEFNRTTHSKIKLFTQQIESAKNSENALYVALSHKLVRGIDSLAIELSALVKDLQGSANIFQNLNMKQILVDPDFMNMIKKSLGDKISSAFDRFVGIISALTNLERTIERLMIEEVNIVESIKQLRELNNPILFHYRQLVNHLKTLRSYAQILLNPKSNALPQMPKANRAHAIEKCFEIFKKISRTLEQLNESLKAKILAENAGCDLSEATDDTGTTGSDERDTRAPPVDPGKTLVYNIQLKASITLKNFNNQISQTFTSVVTSMNSVFSSILNIFTHKNAYVIVDELLIFGVQRLEVHKINQEVMHALNKSKPGINYNTALENKVFLEDLQKKEKTLRDQITSLRNALALAENQLHEKENTIQDQFESISRLEASDAKNQSKVLHFEMAIAKMKENVQELLSKNNLVDQIDEQFFRVTDFPDEGRSETAGDVTAVTDISLTADGRSVSHNNDPSPHDFSEEISKGLQRISLRLVKEKDKLIPLNEMITKDAETSEKTLLVYETMKKQLIRVLLQSDIFERKYVEAMQRREEKEKQLLEERRNKDGYNTKIQDLEKLNRKLQMELESIRENYDNQIKMLTENILELTQKNKK
eukprot:TRINITY_DN7517_c0_g1_i3.p1 TRINITY_DN7517_c0_g1~~TRINITY_DN7517_c0_g1_i3.p1  ORF type:complete len:874 (+),score=277.10 TRINITY_DN7517_c0_g1_i3:1785-4406(+)